mgnify:CR=1 FL=1
MRLRVYERGAGETLACGTGACAAVAAGIRLGLLDARPYRGVVVEWPERLAQDPTLRPTHVLKVSFTENDTLRDLTWGAVSR